MSLSDDLIFLQSTSPTTLLGTVVVLLVLYLFYYSSSNHKQVMEPPGPKPLPLLGNLLQLDLQRPHNTLCELSKKYGSVFTVYFGLKKVVVLSGYRTVKEALVNHAEEFGDREITPILKDVNPGHGILFANGESWKEMRRFALTNLRDFGMGKKAVEENILEESQQLIKLFETYEGKAFDTTRPLNYAASNIISSIMYGNRFEYTDSQFKDMVNRVNENIRIAGSASIQLYNTFPWLGKWMRTRKLFMANTQKQLSVVKDLVKQLNKTLNPQMCRGFVDSFLTRVQKDKDSGESDSYYHEENLIFSVGNLFSAGTDTTATTLKWGLLFMAKYPQIQDQVQEELSRVIGSRQVRVEDRRNLPYTDAAIHETQRLASVVPLSIPHATNRDVTFQGYFIKKGTTVIPLLMSVLNDENEWKNPDTFSLAHFLDEHGKFVKKDAFMPFSAGRRACPGESLARMELFLFFASVLQHFRFTPPPGVTEDELDLTSAVGFTRSPSPHQLCAVTRL